MAKVYVIEPLRILRGRNKSSLVLADNGRHYVQKVFNPGREGSDRLFNEALGSQLGTALGLSFPAWTELWADRDQGFSAHPLAVNSSRQTAFGSELIQGDVFEILPGNWYKNVENRDEIYRCLLFDLWCGHTDSRQVLFQSRGQRIFHAYFFDHDQLFSPNLATSIPKCIAQGRYLDQRIYEASRTSLLPDLLEFAARIKSLADKGLQDLVRTVPASWGSWSHRKQALSGLQLRSNQLYVYVEGILRFADSLGESSESAPRLRHCAPLGLSFGVCNLC